MIKCSECNNEDINTMAITLSQWINPDDSTQTEAHVYCDLCCHHGYIKIEGEY